MSTAHWARWADQTCEFWDELYWVIAQWICQERARAEPAPEATHIEVPAEHNAPCDWCYDEAWAVMRGGLVQLFQICGSVAYSCGRSGIPEDDAAVSALQAVVTRVHDIEQAKILLAQLDKHGWHRLPLERDQCSPECDDEVDA